MKAAQPSTRDCSERPRSERSRSERSRSERPRALRRLGLGLGLLLCSWASACDGLLGDVQIEMARLSPDPDGAAGTTGAPEPPPPACEPSARRCVDARLERCNDEQTGWQVVDECASPELCELTRESGTPICEPPRCSEDERRCRAETLTVCNAGRTGFDDEATCDAAVFCDPEQGRCGTRSCEAGERRCNGAQIEACNADGDAFEPIDAPPCGSSALCVRTGEGDVSCRDPVCDAGDFRCVGGGLLQRCSVSRDAWQDVRACDALDICDPALGLDGCRPADCQRGDRRCSDDALLECNATRDGFDVVANCGAAGCDPDTSECRDPCLVGAPRCAGANVEECSDPLEGWRVVDTCPASAVCDVTAPSGCREAACAPNARRCRGADVERCNDERNGFDVIDTCATEALCVPNGNNARCAEPACDSGERNCRGRVLEICNADRTGFDEITCGLLGCNANANPPDCRGL